VLEYLARGPLSTSSARLRRVIPDGSNRHLEYENRCAPITFVALAVVVIGGAARSLCSMIIARRSRIVLFLILTFALSSVVELKMLPIFVLMWCPGIAAIAVRLLFQRNLQGCGWKWRATPLAIVSYLLPPALALVVYGAVWLTGIGGFQAAGLVSGEDLGHQLALPATILIHATLGFP
jgi:hypothetical protein